MSSLKTDVGELDPLQGSGIDGVPVGALLDGRVLAEPAADADGAFVVFTLFDDEPFQYLQLLCDTLSLINIRSMHILLL